MSILKSSRTQLAMAVLATAGFAQTGSAAVASYSSDFESVDATSASALGSFGEGFKVFADVWGGEVGTGIFVYQYGPFSAPNGGGAFSEVGSGEGGTAQGDQYLNVFSDYNNVDQGTGQACGPNMGCTINTSVFQESRIAAGDIGSTLTFTFDAKSPSTGGISDATQPITEASAFIKTLDQANGYATTNDMRVDMTSISNTDWTTFTISLDLTDELLEGQLIQWGFNAATTEFDSTGVY